MKIQVDSVASAPFHTLSVKKVKLALRLLPSEWTESVRVVRLSNQTPEVCSFDRPVILAQRLTICDRGVPEMKIVRELYMELAQRFSPRDGKLRAHYGNRLDPQQVKVLNEVIQPYLDEYEELKWMGD
ncbi:MAG: hypothetical protein ACSHX6_06225 [Akkermansiaceae bacterium]